MDFAGIPGYRPPHPQDPQSMPPPPPPNFPPQGMPRDQSMGAGPMFPTAGLPPRMPPGYPPMGDPHLPARYPLMPGQDQGLPMGYQPSGPLQNSGMPPGYHPHMGNPMHSRPPQNVSHRFQQSINHGPNLPPQNFHHQQHHQHHQQHGNVYHTHPPQHHHVNDYRQQHGQQMPLQHIHQPQHPLVNDFHPHQPAPPPEFHPQTQNLGQEYQAQQQNNVVNDYHSRHVNGVDFSQHDRSMSHDFHHGSQDHQNMMAGYLDPGSMGMQSLMDEHGMLSQVEGHMLGGGDAYSQHHMMNMYGDPTSQDLRDGDFV